MQASLAGVSWVAAFDGDTKAATRKRLKLAELGPPTLLRNRVSNLLDSCIAACNEGINKEKRTQIIAN